MNFTASPNAPTRPGLNPSGLCMCGCGDRAPLATVSNRRSGAVAGQPQRFIAGHNGRVQRAVWRGEGDPHRVDEATGCWLWQRAQIPSGYGRMWDGTKVVQAHRFYFEKHVRPLLPGEAVHHKCNTPACVNPDHLEAMSAIEHRRHHGNWKAEVIRIALDSRLTLDEIRTRLGVV